MKFPTKTEARKLFWGLKEEVEAAEAEIEPLNAALADVAQEEHKLALKRKKIADRKNAIVVGRKLFEKKNELAGLARFLGGSTGKRPETTGV